MPDASPAPESGADWPAQAAGTIVRLVEQVRDKTTGPAEKAARGVVYGALAGVVGLLVLVLLPVALIRELDEITQSIWGTHETYLAYAVVALLFTVAGMVLWSKRRPKADDA
jgi:hypothetical protein